MALIKAQWSPGDHVADALLTGFATDARAYNHGIDGGTDGVLASGYGAQGKRDEARNLLAPVYGWFSEGFDKLDLKEDSQSGRSIPFYERTKAERDKAERESP